MERFKFPTHDANAQPVKGKRSRDRLKKDVVQVTSMFEKILWEEREGRGKEFKNSSLLGLAQKKSG